MRNNNNSLLLDITNILLGLIILLLGMRLVSIISISVTASFINVIPLCLSLWYVLKTLKISRFIGQGAEKTFIVIIALWTLFCITYSYIFVYYNYMNGQGELCAHSEHVWFYDNLMTIAHFSHSDWNSGALADLHLGKYENLSVYGSLFVRYGGDVPTNMCIWSAFNLALVAILMVLSLSRLGLNDQRCLWFIMLLCLTQPYLDMIFACHRDGYGQSAIMLGFYIFASTYNKPFSKIIAFPFYALLFWTFRSHYLIIAVVMLFWSIIKGNSNSFLNIVLGIGMVALVVAFLMMTINIVDYAKTEMYVGGYEDADERAGRSFINMFLISTLGYFPWPNLLKDALWPWQIFAVFQGAMNMAIIYYLFMTFKNRLREFVDNPTLFLGLLLFAASMFVPGHMSYTVVAMPFLASGLTNVDRKKFFRSYGISILIVLVVGFFYSILGLSGTRAFV